MIKKLILYLFYFLQRCRFYSSYPRKKIYRFIFKNKKKYFESKIKINRSIGYINVKYEDQYFLKKKIDQCIADAIKIYNKNKYSTGSKIYLRNILNFEYNKEIKNFLNFFLDEGIVDTVKNYLATEPLMVELKLLHSPIISNQNNKSGSQLFHCDYDDDQIVKVFLNIFDVDKNTGPLEALSADKSAFIKKKLKLNLGEHTDHIENYITNDEIRSFIGKRGDLTLIDTSSCFHRGSYGTKKDRLILYANFVSRNSYRFTPIFKNVKDQNINKLHSPLSKLSYLVSSREKKFYLNNK